jgi:hypothetical protein
LPSPRSCHGLSDYENAFGSAEYPKPVGIGHSV